MHLSLYKATNQVMSTRKAKTESRQESQSVTTGYMKTVTVN